MIIRTTGPVTPELHVMGDIGLPSFLIEAARPAIIDAGMTCMGEHYVRHVRQVLDGRQPAFFFLTHAHYDHCGAVAVLKNAFPEMQICCAEAGEQVLQRPRAIQTIRDLNRAGAGYLASMGSIGTSPDFEPFPIDHVIADGETFFLGDGLNLRAIATPGHTRDSICYYVPEKKILFTGEALGIMEDDGYIFSEWLTDYDDYRRAIKRLESLEVEVLCLGHGRILTGQDVADYLPRAMAHCLTFREMIENTLHATGGDMEETRRRIKATEYDPRPDPKQPEFAYLLNLDAKIRAVQRLAE